MADTRKKKLQMVLEAMEAAKNPMSPQDMGALLNDYQAQMEAMRGTPNGIPPALLNNAQSRKTMEYTSNHPLQPGVQDQSVRPIPLPAITRPGMLQNPNTANQLYRMMQ